MIYFVYSNLTITPALQTQWLDGFFTIFLCALCVCVCVLMLWGHESVYTVTLCGHREAIAHEVNNYISR